MYKMRRKDDWLHLQLKECQIVDQPHKSASELVASLNPPR